MFHSNEPFRRNREGSWDHFWCGSSVGAPRRVPFGTHHGALVFFESSANGRLRGTEVPPPPSLALPARLTGYKLVLLLRSLTVAARWGRGIRYI